MIAMIMIVLAVGLSVLNSYSAAPFCNLRNPSQQIYSLFPKATSYRSIVREVNNNVRRTLASTVPFQLHPNEVGEHTLYVPVENGKALGIVHVRSEMINWGMAEIVWGLDADLKVIDVRFQRCRGRACKSLIEKGFSASLAGKSALDFTVLLHSDGFTDEAARFDLNESEIQLARALLQSAIKTIAVTRIAWPSTVLEIQSE